MLHSEFAEKRKDAWNQHNFLSIAVVKFFCRNAHFYFSGLDGTLSCCHCLEPAQLYCSTH